jgi:hypothetical protein
MGVILYSNDRQVLPVFFLSLSQFQELRNIYLKKKTNKKLSLLGLSSTGRLGPVGLPAEWWRSFVHRASAASNRFIRNCSFILDGGSLNEAQILKIRHTESKAFPLSLSLSPLNLIILYVSVSCFIKMVWCVSNLCLSK